jgi:hypothetical protein
METHVLSAPDAFGPKIIQETKINRSQLQGLLADYTQIIDAFENPEGQLDKPINQMTLKELDDLDVKKLNITQLRSAKARQRALARD